MGDQSTFAAMGSELIEKIRSTTGLSHETCQKTLQVILEFLEDRIVDLPESVREISSSLHIPNAIRNNPTILDNSADARKLQDIFRNLVDCKNDSQQRSWALHEDLDMITENLEQLITILREADQEISKRIIRRDQYGYVLALVQYYQMETRWPIRKLLLESFALMSTVDESVLSAFVNSILPMELGRELLNNLIQSESDLTLERTLIVGQLLSLLWSTGEKMPVAHFDVLGEKFINKILEAIEDPPGDDDRIVDVFMTVILAFNLQFSGRENITISAIGKRNTTKIFTQKIVYLLNWEQDPIIVLPHKVKTCNSVQKLMLDLFTFPETSDIFYTNDIKVLIDIVTRCIADLGPNDDRRNYYLRLMRMVIRNTAYGEHQHRKDDLQKSFVSILTEDNAGPDQALVNDILEEFPHIFTI